MIKIVKGTEVGYSSDRAVIKLTHSFTNTQLLDLAAAAVAACGMDEVLLRIGAPSESARPRRPEFAAFEYHTNALIGRSFDSKRLVQQVEAHVKQTRRAVSIVTLFAKVESVLKPGESAVKTTYEGQ